MRKKESFRHMGNVKPPIISQTTKLASVSRARELLLSQNTVLTTPRNLQQTGSDIKRERSCSTASDEKPQRKKVNWTFISKNQS